MSSIVKRGSSFAVVYRALDPATGKRRQVWESFATEREAKRRQRKVDEGIETGTHAVPTKMSLRQFVEDRWLPSLEARELKPATVANYRTLVTTHVLPHLGGLQLQAITGDRLDALYGMLRATGRRPRRKPDPKKPAPPAAGLSPTTVRSVHVTISKALGDAVDWGLLTVNPAAKAKAVPTAARTEMRVWSSTQLRAFLASVADDRLVAMWLLLITTGMRRGEVAGLRWSDLDLDGGRLTVAQVRTVVDYAVITDTPKTEKSRRTIALDPATVTALKSHRAAQAAERLAWGPSWCDEGLVFVREDGTAFHPDRIRQMFRARAKVAGLPPIRLHDLRHSYATAALEAGEALKVVSDRLGHSSIAITGDLYSHVREEIDARAAANVATFILGGAQ